MARNWGNNRRLVAGGTFLVNVRLYDKPSNDASRKEIYDTSTRVPVEALAGGGGAFELERLVRVTRAGAPNYEFGFSHNLALGRSAGRAGVFGPIAPRDFEGVIGLLAVDLGSTWRRVAMYPSALSNVRVGATTIQISALQSGRAMNFGSTSGSQSAGAMEVYAVRASV